MLEAQNWRQVNGSFQCFAPSLEEHEDKWEVIGTCGLYIELPESMKIGIFYSSEIYFNT
jgi:hypothetical protein